MSWERPSVYLAGHIAGLRYGSAVDWRKEAAESFRQDGIIAISPMRYKEFLAERGVARLDSAELIAQCSAYEGILVSDPFVSLRAERDIRQSDLVLANFIYPGELPEDLSKAVTKGTLLEVGLARGIRKPIVTVMEPGNIHDHAVVRGWSDFIVSDLETGIKVAKAYLLPGRNFINVEGFRPRC